MRHIYSLLFILITASSVWAQEDIVTTKQKKDITHELSVNATFFVKQFLNFSENENIEISPYVVSYKRITPNKRALRTGLGLAFNNSSQDSDDINDTKRSSTNANVDVRIGIERQIQLGKKWGIFVGGDLVGIYDVSKTVSTSVSDKVTTKTTNYRVGAGPVIGPQIFFNDRISLYTETALLLRYGQFVSESNSEQNLFINSRTATETVSMSFILPTSLFFAVRF